MNQDKNFVLKNENKNLTGVPSWKKLVSFFPKTHLVIGKIVVYIIKSGSESFCAKPRN
jgi:hypothetical protein